MKRSEYKDIYQSLDLSEAQKERINSVVDNALSGGSRGDKIGEHYLDAINSIFRFFSGDMQGHDEFDCEFNLTEGYYWDLAVLNRVVDRFDMENAEHASIYKVRAEYILRELEVILTPQQYEMLSDIFANHFRRYAWFLRNWIGSDGEGSVANNGAYLIAKVSFIRFMGVPMEDLANSCLAG